VLIDSPEIEIVGEQRFFTLARRLNQIIRSTYFELIAESNQFYSNWLASDRQFWLNLTKS
jgi:hypothetical protein